MHGQVPEEPTPQAAGTEYFSLDVEDVPAAGLRPGVLAEPRPQEPVQRHTLEHIVDFVCCSPVVQIIDAPVPQSAEQLPDVLRFFVRLSTFPEQVIEVPKISFRAVLRDPQLAEQLVEVPTIVSYSSLQRNVEQNVDIPVPCRGGRNPGLRALLSGHSSTASRLALERMEHIVDFPVSLGGLQDCRPDRVHPLLRMFQLAIKKAWMSLVNGVFALFSVGKKSARAAASPNAELPREVLMVLVIAGLLVISCSSSPVCWSSRARHRRFAGRLFLLLGPGGCDPVQRGGRVRRCCVWWLSGACLVAGALRRSSVRDVLCPDGFMEAFNIEAVGGVEGLGIPSPHLGCHIVGSLALLVSSTCAQLVLLVKLLALCFLRSRQAQMCVIMAGMFLRSRQAQMLDIMAGMFQKDRLYASLAVACTRLVLLVTMHFALCSFG